MVGRIFVALVALLLAGTGVAFLMWFLWWLWKQREEPAAAPAVEIEAVPTRLEVEAPTAEVEVLVAELEEQPDVQAGPELPEAAESARPPELDDLKRIEGIGPKLASVLQAAGVGTFASLAQTDVSQLQQILEEADPRLLRLADPSSWAEQAELAAKGDWEALEALKGELKAGRRT